jgi:hypothetical protein
MGEQARSVPHKEQEGVMGHSAASRRDSPSRQYTIAAVRFTERDHLVS